jgi:hypothetical protein
MTSVDEHLQGKRERGEHRESHGWARNALAGRIPSKKRAPGARSLHEKAKKSMELQFGVEAAEFIPISSGRRHRAS